MSSEAIPMILDCSFVTLCHYETLIASSPPNPPQVFPSCPAAPNTSEFLGCLVWTKVGSPLAVLKGPHCKGRGSGRCAEYCGGEGWSQSSEQRVTLLFQTITCCKGESPSCLILPALCPLSILTAPMETLLESSSLSKIPS